MSYQKYGKLFKTGHSPEQGYTGGVAAGRAAGWWIPVREPSPLVVDPWGGEPPPLVADPCEGATTMGGGSLRRNHHHRWWIPVRAPPPLVVDPCEGAITIGGGSLGGSHPPPVMHQRACAMLALGVRVGVAGMSLGCEAYRPDE